MLSVKGMGQYNFSLATGSNAKPLYNCNDVTFDYSNSSGQPVRLYIYFKLNLTDSYTQIPGYTTVSNGTSSNYGNSTSGFYKAEFKNSSGTSTLFTSSEYEVEIRPTPSSPVITSNSPICEGATLTLNTTAVSGGTFSWTGVNGFSGSGVSPNIPNVTAASTGNYSATVTVNGCTSEPSNTLSATVNTRPTVNITSSNTTICEGDNVVVDMNVTATGTWSITVTDGFVNGTGSGLKSFVIYPTTNKTYSILNAVDINCPSISSDLIGSITVSVDALSVGGTIAGGTTVCSGTNSATLTLSGNTGSVTKWQSSTDAAFTTPADILTTTSSYNLSNLTSKLFYRAVVKNGVCAATNSSNADVSVDALSVGGTIAGSTTVCSGTNSATLTLSGNTGSITKWQSSTDAAFTTPEDIVNATSSYNLSNLTSKSFYRAVVKNGVCAAINSSNADIGVNSLPAKPTLTSPVICEGATATVTMSTPTGTNTYTYNWQVPTGVATSTSNSVTTTKAGTYSLSITDANTCTSEVGIGTVSVNPLPTLTITNPTAICAPGTVDLTATSITAGSTASLTYTYFTNAAATTSLANANTISTTGAYYIKGTTALNCSAIKAVNATVNPIPTFNLTSPSVCLGTSLTITANPLTGAKSDYNYIWQVPSGVSNPANVSNFTTTTSGVYTATIKNKTTNCESAFLNTNAIFYPLPIAKAIVASDNKVIVNKTLNLTAAASGGTSPYKFTWTPSSTMNYSISGQENAVFNAIKEGKVNIKFQVKDENNCEAKSGDYEITIESEDIVLVLPNAFTPNGDGKNDEFKIVAINTLGQKSFLYFEIYNRNGKLLTNKITDYKAGWNGRSLAGDMQDMGVYFVKLVKFNKDGIQVVETTPIYLLK